MPETNSSNTGVSDHEGNPTRPGEKEGGERRNQRKKSLCFFGGKGTPVRFQLQGEGEGQNVVKKGRPGKKGF